MVSAIAKSIEKPLLYGGKLIEIKADIGSYLVNRHTTNMNEALRVADLRMFKAKFK
jgi:hypothetical protein